MLPVSDVPTTIVTGFLGVGKTTAILNTFRHPPPDERWAELENDFGDVGIDGATLEGGGLFVHEVPGGCICCSAGLPMKLGLVKLLREVRPDRLFIEPTGLAHPASILDTLRSPGLGRAVSVRATIGLVDPRKFLLPRYRENDTYADQVQIADVLVANRCDQAGPEDIAAFREAAAALYPPKLVIATTAHGALDPAWLDLAPAPRAVTRPPHLHDHPPVIDLPTGEVTAPVRREGAGAGFSTCGWIFPPTMPFDRDRLEDLLMALARPGPLLPEGAARLKGVFRTPGAWLLIQADPESIQSRPIGYRRDSRVEIIAAGEADWAGVEAALEDALWRPAL